MYDVQFYAKQVIKYQIDKRYKNICIDLVPSFFLDI